MKLAIFVQSRPGGFWTPLHKRYGTYSDAAIYVDEYVREDIREEKELRYMIACEGLEREMK